MQSADSSNSCISKDQRRKRELLCPWENIARNTQPQTNRYLIVLVVRDVKISVMCPRQDKRHLGDKKDKDLKVSVWAAGSELYATERLQRRKPTVWPKQVQDTTILRYHSGSRIPQAHSTIPCLEPIDAVVLSTYTATSQLQKKNAHCLQMPLANYENSVHTSCCHPNWRNSSLAQCTIATTWLLSSTTTIYCLALDQFCAVQQTSSSITSFSYVYICEWWFHPSIGITYVQSTLDLTHGPQ